MTKLAEVFQLLNSVAPEKNQEIDQMYINRQFSAGYGGKALIGGSYEWVRKAEQIRRDFLESCKDQEVARIIATQLNKTRVWIRVKRLGFDVFEDKAIAVYQGAARIDGLLDKVRANPPVCSPEEIERMSKEAAELIDLHLELISGDF